MPSPSESASATTAAPGGHALNGRRAWGMLVLGLAAQTTGSLFVGAPAFLIPLLHTERGLSLAQAGTLASAPTFGMVITLVAWGALADKIGERWVLAGGLALTSLAALGAVISHGYLPLGFFLVLGGMASASSNAASGRVVLGWFTRDRRGFAMGVRQMAQPVGVTLGALTVPSLAAGGGLGAALILPCALTGLLAVLCAVFIVNPPRPASVPADSGAVSAKPANPYRASSFLWRIHAVSALMVVPQFTLTTFGLVWLVTQHHWSSPAAGVLLGAAGLIGALGRIVVGMLSDRVRSRVRPLRWVATSTMIVMLILAGFDAAHWGAAAAVYIVAAMITVAPNGLAYTSVAEMAGPAWAGRALGTQNTGQFLVSAAVGPAIGALIGVVGYPLSFVTAAICPAIAIPLVPRGDAEHDRL